MLKNPYEIFGFKVINDYFCGKYELLKFLKFLIRLMTAGVVDCFLTDCSIGLSIAKLSSTSHRLVNSNPEGI